MFEQLVAEAAIKKEKDDSSKKKKDHHHHLHRKGHSGEETAETADASAAPKQ